jgi:hypothetical protein
VNETQTLGHVTHCRTNHRSGQQHITDFFCHTAMGGEHDAQHRLTKMSFSGIGSAQVVLEFLLERPLCVSVATINIDFPNIRRNNATQKRTNYPSKDNTVIG